MPASISLTETQIMTALRAVLAGIVAPGVEIIRAEINRVPEPIGPDFILMTPIHRVRLATNIATFTDTPLTAPPVAARDSLAKTEITIQIDVHGPASADNATMISTLLRDEYAWLAFSASGYDVAPLHAEDPRQVPFINGEQAYEFRWVVDVVLAANITVRTAQDFADVVDVGLIEVDTL
jgi:hypothetical protein